MADNTDVYLFRDPTDQSKVTVIANFVGLEQPAAGPNFNRFGDDVLYEIHVDNDHDVVADVTYQFRFRTTVRNNGTFLYNTNQLTSPNDPDRNVVQTYSVRKVTESGAATVLVTDAVTPPEHVGPRSVPGDYEATLAQPAVTALPGGGKVFAGPRKDAFYADLGSVFDLLGVRPAPFNTLHAIDQPAEPARDGLAGKNVHTIALQLPIGEVTRTGAVPTVEDSKDSVIGVYASSSRQRVKILSPSGAKPRTAGRWVQVSRLGVPLVNEVLIPLGLKDRWNASDPKDDAQFFPNILDPEPAKLVAALYDEAYTDKSTKVPPGGAENRPDLIKLLTGQLIGLSAANALPPADLLRINLARPADTADQNVTDDRLGALAGDPLGFPNGRRLRDDVVDIELRVLSGLLLGAPYDDGANPVLGDAVNGSDRPYLNVFPYQATPVSGFDQNDQADPLP
ncbi:MAG: DUF4331 domain-containing protein [Actinomycetota bacterium]|nr:DUF4331 domain-containing protein [Actinomycetota bacterium]